MRISYVPLVHAFGPKKVRKKYPPPKPLSWVTVDDVEDIENNYKEDIKNYDVEDVVNDMEDVMNNTEDVKNNEMEKK